MCDAANCSRGAINFMTESGCASLLGDRARTCSLTEINPTSVADTVKEPFKVAAPLSSAPGESPDLDDGERPCDKIQDVRREQRSEPCKQRSAPPHLALSYANRSSSGPGVSASSWRARVLRRSSLGSTKLSSKSGTRASFPS